MRALINTLGVVCLVLSFVGCSESTASSVESKMLTDSEVRQALVDFTGSDRKTLEAFDGAVNGNVKMPYLLDPENRAMLLLGYSMNEGMRIAEIDWASGYNSALVKFQTLYALEAIEWPSNIASQLEELLPKMQRGDDVDYVVALLTESVSESGYEILNINTGADTFWFFLAPVEASKKWRNSSVGSNYGWIENPQWQFTEKFEALGLRISYPEPPSTTAVRQ